MFFKTTFLTNLDSDKVPDTIHVSFGEITSEGSLPVEFVFDSSQDIYAGEKNGGSVTVRTFKRVPVSNVNENYLVTEAELRDCSIDIVIQQSGNPAKISGSISIPTPRTKIPQGLSNISSEARLTIQQIEMYGVELEMEKGCQEQSGGFTLGELKDIKDVLQIYKRYIGDLKRFQIKLDVYRYYGDELRCENDERGPITKTCDPGNRGAVFRGQTNQEGDLEIKIKPKDLLDAHHAWMKSNGLYLQGQKGQIHNFKWTFIHEIAHQISYKLGFGYEMIDYTDPSSVKTPFVKEWGTLQKQIEMECPIPKETRYDVVSRHVRFQGYPSDYSTGNDSGGGILGEIWADTVTYILTDSHYADDDVWFMKRVKLVRNFLKTIEKKASR